MVGLQGKIPGVRSVQYRVTLLILLCHGFILAVALFEMPIWLSMQSASAFLIPAASVLSFVLLLSIPYNLHLLEIRLQSLANGFTIEPISLHWRWPLAPLFALVNELARRSGQQGLLEQRNVAYRDQLLQQVRKAAAQEELNRLARDLHDSIKQQIFSIAISAAAVKARWERDPARALAIVDDIERVAQETQVEMQALLQQLRPVALENVGLIESLRLQCQALGYRTGAEISIELGQLPADALLPPGAQESIFRIVQEGFANIARYARPAHVWLSLRQQHDVLLLEIGDDGQGFDVTQASERASSYGGMGLRNVRERASALGGTVTIWSLPGQGTTLHLSIPLVGPVAREPVEQEVAQLARQTRRSLRVGLIAAQFAGALTLLYSPLLPIFWLAGLSLVVALAAWFWAQQYRLQFALEAGQKHVQHAALQVSSYGLLSVILFLGLLYPEYLALFHSLWLTLLYTGLCGCAMLVTYGLYVRYTWISWRGLTREQWREWLPQQARQLAVDWLVWGLIVAVVVFWLNALAGDDWSRWRLCLLAVWGLALLLKGLRMMARGRLLATGRSQGREEVNV